MPGGPNHGGSSPIGLPRIGREFHRYVAEPVVVSVRFDVGLFGLLFLTDLTAPTLELGFVTLVPFMVLLVSSGRIDDLHFGDRSMKVQEAAKGGISPDGPSEPFAIQEDEGAGKGGHDRLEEMVQEERSSVAFRLGRWDDTDSIRRYLRRNLSENPDFRYLLFTEQDGRCAGVMKADDFVSSGWLHADEDGDDRGAAGDRARVLAAIREGDILDAASVITTRIQDGSTLGEAMQKMEDADSEILALVDSDDEFVGVLTSEKVTSQVLRRLMGEREV